MTNNYDTPKNNKQITDSADQYFNFSFEKCLRNYEIIPTPVWKNMVIRKLDYF